MIHLQNVSKKYKRKEVLEPFTLTIREGSSVGVIGPNGAGKSTFLKLVASLDRPTKGKVFYDDIPYDRAVRRVRADIGYVPQDIALYEELTVKEQISFWRKLEKGKVDEGFLQTMIEMLRLDEVYQQRVDRLSGGWKRKVNLCIGLMRNPRICLLDEPTAGVDLAAKEDILSWLRQLHADGKTLIYISHDWYELKTLSDEFLLFAEKKPIFQGSQAEWRERKEELLKSYESHKELKRILEFS
ncbi:ABC transporter ATP-binding protein [Halobacillus sp. ACCC02827]|uniref:ABC transporter ATP-binding protein n=1 Tax=Halobacillus sp. ACCC02827 TaxID=3052090 RepID=UPI00257121D9|nr:ABC transporter ATP-binding protein [Halobacillus sp. ACCC02827]WJE15047.1 ABC transporter ATP-binding protein [Halobacillus sp. ACCC02827]